ncbi:Disease resistance protein [Nymphaea thermarum]|nr:Disease resistance protein [Nymphaea thermarum]
MHRCSIANLSKLEELNLQGCQQLQFLPGLPSSLKTLILQGCKRLKPALGFQNLESMELLDMDGCENINFTLMSGLFKGKTFSHLEELSASRSKTKSEDEAFSFVVPRNSPSNALLLQQLHCYGDETFSFVVPLGSPSSPLLLQQLQCYGDGSKSDCLSYIYIKVCVKDMEDNRVIYETIFSGHRDFDNDIGGQCWCYTVSFSEYDDINILSNLCRPCSISISTANDFFLRSVHILLRSASKWSKNYSKMISVGENVTNSRRISAEQNQINAFEFDVLFRYVKEDIDTEFINNLYRALQQHGICMFKGEDALNEGGELLNCIERSAICIPIFSKRFSQSKWHLKSVAKMEYAIYMWEDCGYSPTDAIEVLQHRSLIRIDEKGRFKMDDRVRHVGRVMVEKHELTPSRIWNENNFPEDLDGWTAGWSNDNIEGINAIFSRYRQGPMRIEAMGNLRILHLTNCYFQYNRLQPLKNLRWLQLEMCDVNSWIFKDGGIFEKLLVLQLHCCRMLPLDMQEVVSAGNKHQEVFKKLKVLEIKRCSDGAMAYLDFSLMPSLVKLVIEGIEYSRYFRQIRRSIWGLGKLEYLRIIGGAVKKLSSSIRHLSSLQTLDLEDTWLSELPEGLGDLAALRELILSGCVSLKHLPQLPCSLQTLDLGGCILLSELPEGLGNLAALRELILSGCVSLKHLPQLPCSLQTLVLGGCTLLSELPESLGDLATLRELILSGCVSLDHLPQLPPSLQRLDLRGSKRLLELPKDLGDLAALRELILRNCNELKEIPSSVVQLKHLRTLIVINCCRLRHLPQLPSSLITLDAYGCIKLRQVADISNLPHLEILNLDRCDVLEVVPGLHNLQSLTFLRLPFHISQREKL